MNFYDKVLQYFEESKIALVKRFVPPYICSIANHILNIENQKREFYFEQGQVSNMRMHVFFCAPPGFTKTLLLSKFLEGPYSILGRSETVNSGFEGAMTEAGFVGSIKMINDEPAETLGAAHDHRESILGIDEFAALTNMMKMEHSMNLDNAMLTALDKGYVRKRLAAGKIEYSTQLTLMTGSQPARFDLTGGLGRRFWFEFFIPTLAEERLIKIARREGKNVRVPMSTLNDCAKCLDEIYYEANQVERISFDTSFYALLDRLKIPHFEEILFEKFALGYVVAKYGIEEHITISWERELSRLLEQGNKWRQEIKQGAELSQIMIVIREMTEDANAPPTRTEVMRRMINYGMEPGTTSKIMGVLQKQGSIEIFQEKRKSGGRPRILVILRDD